MILCHYGWRDYYIEPGVKKVFKKVLIDTKNGNVVTERCSNTYRFKDDVTKCCGREYINSDDDMRISAKSVQSYMGTVPADEVPVVGLKPLDSNNRPPFIDDFVK